MVRTLSGIFWTFLELLLGIVPKIDLALLFGLTILEFVRQQVTLSRIKRLQSLEHEVRELLPTSARRKLQRLCGCLLNEAAAHKEALWRLLKAELYFLTTMVVVLVLITQLPIPWVIRSCLAFVALSMVLLTIAVIRQLRFRCRWAKSVWRAKVRLG